jgi:hypothetical protein
MKTLTGKFGVWAVAGATVFLSGCAQIARTYDSLDRCQQASAPSYCGASQVTGRVIDSQGRTIGIIKRP